MVKRWQRCFNVAVLTLLANEILTSLMIIHQNKNINNSSSSSSLSNLISDAPVVAVDLPLPPPPLSSSGNPKKAKFIKFIPPTPPNRNTSKSDGIDDLRHACLSYHDDDDDTTTTTASTTTLRSHHISYRAVYGSWTARTSDRHDVESFHLASRKNPWLRTSFLMSTEDDVVVVHGDGITNGSSINSNSSINNSSSSNRNNTASPFMFIPAIFDPTHCIQDLLFSLLPLASRGKLLNFTAISVHKPNLPPKEMYDGPILRDNDNWAEDGDYCSVVIKKLEWFGNVTSVGNDTCLGDLWIPPFMYHRFPRGWGQEEQQQQFDSGRSGRSGRSGGGGTLTSGGNEYIHNRDLPLTMMHFFQQQMWKSFIAQNPFLNKNPKPRIVFDSRISLHRGEWTNAHDIASKIKDHLDPDIFEVDVVDDVAALSVAEQAALYHGASIVVAPQGSSLANVVFMKPHSIILEISCGEKSWVRDWASDLKIRHSSVRSEEPSCNFEGHRTFFVRPAALVDLILDICWKGTKKKTN